MPTYRVQFAREVIEYQQIEVTAESPQLATQQAEALLSSDDWEAEGANDWDQWCSEVEALDEQQNDQHDQPETRLTFEEHS